MPGEFKYAVVWKTGLRSRRILCTHIEPARKMSESKPGSRVVELEEPIPYTEMTPNRGVRQQRYPEIIHI